MTGIQKQITELENDAKDLLVKAMAVSPDRIGFIQQKSIRAMQSGLRGWIGINLGELKNAFGIGTEQEFSKNNGKKVQ